MSHCAEFVTFTVTGDEHEFRTRREAAIKEVKASHPGLWSVPLLARKSDGSWVDVWIYDSVDAAHAANADAENLPAFLAMVSMLADIQIEETTLSDNTITPL